MKRCRHIVMLLHVAVILAFGLAAESFMPVMASEGQPLVVFDHVPMSSMANGQTDSMQSSPVLLAKVWTDSERSSSQSSDASDDWCAVPGPQSCMPMLSETMPAASGETGRSFEARPNSLFSDIVPPQIGHPPKTAS